MMKVAWESKVDFEMDGRFGVEVCGRVWERAKQASWNRISVSIGLELIVF